ncbi:MAG: hypothetical protein KF802_10230 [Bdellovibrionaceae bacterium]|nr:hypothetical protein [Pseudobdellovibrionaceae bacterium]MBX3033789.1 hypothetical protein [Pseudobdellovibrionaceae bacterium]
MKLFATLSLLLSCTLAAANLPPENVHAFGGTPSLTDARPLGGDDFVPWPFGSEMPFPWSFVQGVWLAEHGEFRSYFRFRVLKNDDGMRTLSVQQIDPVTCEQIAEGVGIEYGNVVWAQITVPGGHILRMQLRSFHKNAVSVPLRQKPIYDQYVVMSLSNSSDYKTLNMPMQQITPQLNFKCHIIER